jgi:glutamate-1-semialdehyde 2,1-aminomutase
MTAGLATLSQLDRELYRRLEALSASLEAGLLEEASACRVPVATNRVGSMLGLFFRAGKVRNYKDARRSNYKLYPRFHRKMLEGGSYLPPSAFETMFVSAAHSKRDIAATLSAARRAFEGLA